MSNGSRTDRLVGQYTRWVIRNRWLVILFTLVVAFSAGTGARYLGFDTNYRVFFSDENPQLNAFEAMQDIYTKNDNILFVVEAKEGDILSVQNLKAIQELTEDAWKLPYAQRVDAVTNFQHTTANEDELIVGDLVPNHGPLTAKEINDARRVALSDPLLYKRLITDKTNVTGVNVTLQLPGKDPQNEVPKAVTAARELADQYRQKYENLGFYLTGIVMLNNAFSESGIRDMQTLVPLMYLVMFVIMFVLLRSISGTITTILVIMFSRYR